MGCNGGANGLAIETEFVAAWAPAFTPDLAVPLPEAWTPFFSVFSGNCSSGTELFEGADPAVPAAPLLSGDMGNSRKGTSGGLTAPKSEATGSLMLRPRFEPIAD
jgi:hypothetical protein